MFILGVVDFDDQLVFRYILPECLVRLLVNKLMTMTANIVVVLATTILFV